MIDSVQDISSINQLTESLSLEVKQQKMGNAFLAELQKVNDKQIAGERVLQDLATGKADNIHHVMLSLEDAKISFQMLVQVRNKLLEGYQEVLRMQI